MIPGNQRRNARLVEEDYHHVEESKAFSGFAAPDIKDEGNLAPADKDVRSRYAESTDPLAVRAADDVFDPVACAFAACFGDDECALE